MNNVKRVLCIIGGMNAGGAETFMMKVLRSIDRDKYMIDFAVAVKDKALYDDEILELGGVIYHLTPKTKGIISFVKSVYHIVKDNGYKSVLRISQNSTSSIELLIAKIAGASTVGLRSSNSDTCGGISERIGHKIFKPLAIMITNVKIAPSSCAAEFMFGKNCVKNNRVVLIKNGLDTEQYAYNEIGRNIIRKELNISDETIVIGHIGRFNYQKNHKFLLEVFKEVYNKEPKSMLVLVGDGELRQEVISYSESLGINNRVTFLGIRSDIPNILSAMDVFVLPSLFEGMPNTVIEAQTSGLPCVVSNSITPEVNITGNVKFLSLNEDKNKWANMVLEHPIINRKEMHKTMKNNGYDISDSVNVFVSKMFGETE